MKLAIHNIGVASQIGKYSDAVEVAPSLRWLHTSGRPGLSKDRKLPTDITGQAELAWEHLLQILHETDGVDRQRLAEWVTSTVCRRQDRPHGDRG